jgi:simple sugar transport system permease protein
MERGQSIMANDKNQVTLKERWRTLADSPTFPRLIITLFFILVCIVAFVQGLELPKLLSDTVARFGMNIILVLAMVPAIQSGIGPNFGLPLGIITGLLGSLISFELGLVGFSGLIVANLIALPFSIGVGIVFGLMLNRVKGSEMIVSTYTGFAMVSLMSIFWILLPFNHPEMRWPLGRGLRNVVSLDGVYSTILNDVYSLKFLLEKETGNLVVLFNKSQSFIREYYSSTDFIDLFTVPILLLIFVFSMCFLLWLFMRSKTGIMMKAAGDNPRFAKSSGIDVDRSRILGTTLSTVLGGVGITIFSQSYGFIQLYQAPLMAAFPAVAAILIGGASAKNAKISHVIIGTFLFQGLLTISLPTANALFPEGNLSEVLRLIVQNGVILYALTKVGGES